LNREGTPGGWGGGKGEEGPSKGEASRPTPQGGGGAVDRFSRGVESRKEEGEGKRGKLWSFPREDGLPQGWEKKKKHQRAVGGESIGP